MFRIALLSCLVLVAVAQLQVTPELNDEWLDFKTSYNKQYHLLGEDYMRRIIWERNLRYVDQHNLEEAQGLHTYKLGMNEYADMDVSEFVSVMNGLRPNLNRTKCGHFQSSVSVQDLPASVDWTTKGYVTEVKNQGQCGSCWSFSATGSLEGQQFKKSGTLVSLSEKNLMDCSNKYGNQGCQGGLMDQAFEYVIANKGIDTEQSYPYKPKNGKCEFKAANIGAVETACTDVMKDSEDDLQKAVATIGPISVGIDASHASFQLYHSGVYNEKRCSSKQLDHGVLAVGYGTEGSKDFWLVKNSWGKSWGMKGYIKMSRNERNQCGIATQASFPVV